MSQPLVAKLHHLDVHGLPHYLVYAGEQVVGSIRDHIPKTFAPPGGTWFWGISHPHDLGRPRPCNGHAPTREAALAAFRKCWDAGA